MLPSNSDRQTARIHIVLTAISVGTTTLFLLSIILGISALDSGRYAIGSGFFGGRIISPWEISAYLMASGLGSWFSGIMPIWWTIASLAGTIGYGLNIGILTTSIMGVRVQKYQQVSWMGYLMGIIGSGVGITIIFNTMTWWLAGYILMILSLIMTIKTNKQIVTSLETYGDGQAQQTPQQPTTPQQMPGMPSMPANPILDQMQQPFYQNQAGQQQGQGTQQPGGVTPPFGQTQQPMPQQPFGNAQQPFDNLQQQPFDNMQQQPFDNLQQQPMGTAPQPQPTGVTPQTQPVDTVSQQQPVQPMGTTTTVGQTVSFTPQQPVAPQAQQTVTPQAQPTTSEAAEAEPTSQAQASLEPSEADATPVNPQTPNTADEKIDASEGQEQSAPTQPEEPKE